MGMNLKSCINRSGNIATRHCLVFASNTVGVHWYRFLLKSIWKVNWLQSLMYSVTVWASKALTSLFKQPNFHYLKCFKYFRPQMLDNFALLSGNWSSWKPCHIWYMSLVLVFISWRHIKDRGISFNTEKPGIAGK